MNSGGRGDETARRVLAAFTVITKAIAAYADYLANG